MHPNILAFLLVWLWLCQPNGTTNCTGIVRIGDKHRYHEAEGKYIYLIWGVLPTAMVHFIHFKRDESDDEETVSECNQCAASPLVHLVLLVSVFLRRCLFLFLHGLLGFRVRVSFPLQLAWRHELSHDIV